MNDVWVALLRAVNLGGKRVLPSASLRELLAACGATHVRTYIQSGNAVFRMGEGIEVSRFPAKARNCGPRRPGTGRSCWK